MARFKDLPDELILQISLYCDIPHFLPFALVDKHAQSICLPRLSKFQALHKKWKSITLSYKWNVRLVNLLIEILEEPESVRFIRECHSESGSGPAPNWIQQGVVGGRKEHLDRLRGTLSVAPLIDPESYKMWMVALDKIDATEVARRSYPPYSLIWSLLPDLHMVEIPTDARSDITWLRQSPQGSKLKKVYFGSFSNHHFASDDDVIEILRMPSLRELNATGIKISCSPIMSEFQHVEAVPCPLERLAIRSTSLTPERLRNIMDQIQHGPPPRGLQSFTYWHDLIAMGGFYAEFEGRALIDVLLAFTKHSLVKLDLAIDLGPYMSYPFLISSNAFCAERTNIALGRGLQSFQNLQSLAVAAEMLVEGWRMREVREIDREGRPKTRYVDVVDPLAQQICLGEILPLNLRLLKITSLDGNGESQRVLIEKLLVLLECCYYKFPLLKVLKLGWWPEERLRLPLLILCRRLGVQLGFDRPRLSTWGLHLNPLMEMY